MFGDEYGHIFPVAGRLLQMLAPIPQLCGQPLAPPSMRGMQEIALQAQGQRPRGDGSRSGSAGAGG